MTHVPVLAGLGTTPLAVVPGVRLALVQHACVGSRFHVSGHGAYGLTLARLAHEGLAAADVVHKIDDSLSRGECHFYVPQKKFCHASGSFLPHVYHILMVLNHGNGR